MRKVTELSNNDAKNFFLKGDSYCNFALPPYFVFDNLLNRISRELNNSQLSDYYATGDNNRRIKPEQLENVSYKFLNNKDGKYAWRPFQLIHPAIYVELVHKLTEHDTWNRLCQRFLEFNHIERIKCHSIPLESENELSDQATSIRNWWTNVEQQSLKQSLKYEYVLHTDISDCYGSFYTHTIPWALHSKVVAKRRRNDNQLIGNKIDYLIRSMSNGQTNGIPQGSTLMDYIAEIILGYSDLELNSKIENEGITDYYIIRYRDDYRIFTNNPQDAEHIAKLLSETLFELGLKLNSQKTIASNNVIASSIKEDKWHYLLNNSRGNSFQQNLLIIFNLAERYPNSGSLHKALNKYYDSLINTVEDEFTRRNNPEVLINILVDIAYKNPRVYPVASAILSKLLTFITSRRKRNELLESIMHKFQKIPNTGHLLVWLQRVTIKIDSNREYDEKLCEIVNSQDVQLWNSDWLRDNMRTILESENIVSQEIIDELEEVLTASEFDVFDYQREDS